MAMLTTAQSSCTENRLRGLVLVSMITTERWYRPQQMRSHESTRLPWLLMKWTHFLINLRSLIKAMGYICKAPRRGYLDLIWKSIMSNGKWHAYCWMEGGLYPLGPLSKAVVKRACCCLSLLSPQGDFGMSTLSLRTFCLRFPQHLSDWPLPLLCNHPTLALTSGHL